MSDTFDPNAEPQEERSRASEGPGTPGGGDELGDGDDRHTFRTTLFRVLFIQAVALLGLWLLQARYTSF
ncbi:MAG: hypothetical protein ACE5GJ_13325 [Gemmatimonadota bacterium]